MSVAKQLHCPPPAWALACTLLLSACATTDAPRAPDPQEAARVNTELGAGYLRRGRDDLARERLERALEHDADYAPAHATYALLLARTGDDAEADGHFRTAVRLTPDDPDTRNNYGAFLCSRGNRAAAVEQFERAAGAPGYAGRVTALTNAGLCLGESDPRRAESYLRQALDLDPQHPPALEQMAWVSYQRGDLTGTRSFVSRFERVAEPGPDLLWLGWQTERALGDREASERYRTTLFDRHPDFVRERVGGAEPSSDFNQ